jgi:antirestriction protein
MPAHYWNSHTHEEIINFVKTHEDFTKNYEQDAEILCETFEEWCERVREMKNLPNTSVVNRYFDFSRMLRDGWFEGASVRGLQYFLVGRRDDKLYMIDGQELDDAELSWCWAVAVFS